MAKKKVVIDPRPFRVESGPDVGIALRIMYNMVEPDEPGYDLFDVDQLELVKKNLIKGNESGFTFTIVPHGMKQWSRVFAESKRG
jgi:hypothetical protein